ncbi:CoA ester lyase [Hyphomicrobium sp. ghe19]|uniref:HpcH/HpaI aldolase/citrate lyase family protein n=1 Tax=Hyphomicrobium sp. ghe19 TaxID=2682968 RepID=UPI0013670B05|nr:(3S)-malyl-CoA thioesterase [Hyphomicrobium sp. ghe19]
MVMRPRRSVLYLPGDNERALEKARTLPADAIIIDLEDSVAPANKERARNQAIAAIHEGGFGSREVILRVNPIETPWGMVDLHAAIAAVPDAILIPKVSNSGDILGTAKVVKAAEADPRIRLWAMIETPMGIINAKEIAACGPDPDNRLVCLVLGTNDLLKESRALASSNRFAVVPWLAMTLVAARAYGLDVIDGVYNDFKDDLGFRAECEHGRTLGMDGKTLIHPSQVVPCNEVFSPTEEEIAWARKIIRAFEEPENARKGVITVEGRMVERLHLVMAKRVAAIAEAISARSRVEEPWF